MKLKLAIYIPVIIMSLTACTNGGGGGGNGEHPGSKDPQSKEEALKRLSSEHRANFESWQGQVIKSCDAVEAFGLNENPKSDKKGVDGSALIKQNKGSVVFADAKSFAILTGYSSFIDSGQSSISQEININGNSYSISAKTKREGSFCAVYLFGQKVYETKIVENFIIGSQYSADKKASASSGIPVLKNLGVHGAAEVVQHGLFDLLSQSLKPTQEAQVLIGQSLGLSELQTTQYFKLSNYTFSNAAVRVDGDPASVWSPTESASLISLRSSLEKYFDGNFRTLPLEVRLHVPQFEFQGVKNTSDNGNLKLILNASIGKKETGFIYSTASLQNEGLVPFNQSDAEICAKDRLSVYFGAVGPRDSISPSVNLMLSPCKTLFPDIEEASYKNDFLKSLIPVIFANVSPSRLYDYGGWENVLSRLVKEVMAQSKDLVKELDPLNKTKIVSIVAENVERLKFEIEKSKNMELVKNTAYQMVLDWSFQGQLVTSLRVAEIIQSLDNAFDVFKISAERVLRDLGLDLNAKSAELSFARGLDSTYKMEAQKALSLAKGLDDSVFENDIFNQILQKRTSLEELRDWSLRFSSIQTELIKYPLLNSVKGELVGHSLKWLKNGELAPQDLSAVYSALNNTIEPFTHSTQQLIQDLGQSLGANKEILDFSRGLTPEYKQLAIGILNNSRTAENERWGQLFLDSILQKRPAMTQLQQWSEMWTAILGFVQREKARVAGDTGYLDWNRKKVIEVAITEVWSGQEFSAFEALAEVAKAKNTCDHRDASSQAACVGLSLFSKGAKKFFDPAYLGRYGDLASDFKLYMNQLSNYEWSLLKSNLLGELFGTWEPIWSKCDNSSFKQKAVLLKTQMNAILSESDQFKKWELERKIKEVLEDCP